MTRMLYFAFSAMACWMAAMTLLSVPLPLSSRTRRLMRLTLGAMPRKVRVYFGPIGVGLASPPMMPATCSPWPKASLVPPPTKSWLIDDAKRAFRGLQIVVIADAAIDHGDSDSSAVIAVLKGDQGIYCGFGVVERTVDDAVWGDELNVRIGRDVIERPHGYRVGGCFYQMQFVAQVGTPASHPAVMSGRGGDLELDDHIDKARVIGAFQVGSQLVRAGCQLHSSDEECGGGERSDAS